MITEKCKKDFEKWYLDVFKKGNYRSINFDKLSLKVFYSSPLSMQYGVYVDFFDTKGMQIYVKPTSSIDGNWSVYIDDFGHHILTEYIYKDTRHEARTEAINKANTIYNENTN